jgi:hypothetical protein
MGTRWPSFEFMPVDAYQGANGDLVLTQEWSKPEGEDYLRIIMNMKDARDLAERIIALADKAGK